VATQTAFNGTKLLNGGFTGAVFQIGANAGDSITIDSIANSTAANLGSQTSYVYTPGITLSTTGLGAVSAGAVRIYAGTSSAASVFADVGSIASAATTSERLGQVVAAVNDKTGTTGVQAYITSGGALKLRSESNDFYVTVVSETAFVGTASPFSTTNFADGLYLGISDAAGGAESASSNGVSGLSVSNYESSQKAIALVDSALNTINTTRATLGAVQSRFESAVASQQTTSENLAASRSRIQDADFASETANLAKAQILQQSGIAMLAQANAIPQNVLALLQ